MKTFLTVMVDRPGMKSPHLINRVPGASIIALPGTWATKGIPLYYPMAAEDRVSPQ